MRTQLLVMCTVLLSGCDNCGSGDINGSTSSVAPAAEAPGPAIAVASVPAQSKWELDPENSSAEFVCKHVLSKVRGMFALPKGTVFLDETNPSNSKINATILVNNINTGVEERDTHLKSSEFFDAAKYPTITFASTNVSRVNATNYSVSGDLSMHGVTRPVTLAVVASPPFNHAGGIRRGIEATGSVNRKDFDLKWEFPGEGAGVVVGDQIQITINSEMVYLPQ